MPDIPVKFHFLPTLSSLHIQLFLPFLIMQYQGTFQDVNPAGRTVTSAKNERCKMPVLQGT
jgi:hypothetical protein